MKVKNGSCIRRLSRKMLKASKRRNRIAIFAIALTTLLFTSIFTVGMSLNESYEMFQFRQIGGCNHGTFKQVDEQKAEAIASSKRVKQVGERRMAGFASDGVFGKVPAEISYMDANETKWSFAEPETGRMPERGNEIAMDTAALKLLGVEPKLGETVTLTWDVGDQAQEAYEKTDTFTLVGFWEYDDLVPVHFINVSEEYAGQVEQEAVEKGMQPFRRDLNVMMGSSVNIEGQMEAVLSELGYDWENENSPDYVGIGVNWGYTAAQAGASVDLSAAAGLAALLLLVILTGYLIIYNVFQISVTGDIRFYGLLKTIGTTPRQLSRLIRHQALWLSLMGIPAGLAAGWGVGAVLTPVALSRTILGEEHIKVSGSWEIFAGAAAFALFTVLLSCAKPGRIAGKVSPVEAARYTEQALSGKKKRRAFRGAKVHQMAFSNLGRSSRKTVLVIVSLALSVTLLEEVSMFVGGFDAEKYVSNKSCTDFLVSGTDYFRFDHGGKKDYISAETVAQIAENTQAELSGSGYQPGGFVPTARIGKERMGQFLGRNYPEDMVGQLLEGMEKKDGDVVQSVQLEGLDTALFEKVRVLDGDISPLYDPDSRTVAVDVDVDDYGNPVGIGQYPQVGEKITVDYVTEGYYVDTRTGEPADYDATPAEYLELKVQEIQSVEYTVCALVAVPYQLGYRYSMRDWIPLVLPAEVLGKDSGQAPERLFYAFDTPDQETEAAAEKWLSELTAGDLSPLLYESKAKVREDFAQFQGMFAVMGGTLCMIVGIVGILNFFNAVMTGILARQREFAMLQAVGMTGRQLKAMLIWEGMFYTVGSGLIALLLTLIVGPLSGEMMEGVFWFFESRFTIVPVLCVLPVFALLGWLIPAILYKRLAKQSIVERLREF